MMKKVFMHFWRMFVYFCVNNIFDGTNPHYFPIKRRLLLSIGYTIGANTKVVGPIHSTGTIVFGDNCWIGANFTVRGSGTVILGDNIDVAPDVTFLTGTHHIGPKDRRAGDGYNTTIEIGNGCWLGGRTTYVNNIKVGDSCVIAACACVCKSILTNSLVGGVPAKLIRDLK